MFHQSATILYNRKQTPGYYKIGLTCAPGYARSRPGQFVMLHIAGTGGSLLRRPFSIHGLIRQNDRVQGVELLYKVVGPCTKRLAQCRTGDCLDLQGPLGRGFKVEPGSRRRLLLAGGIGVAPILFLADTMARSLDPADCTVFIGGRTQNDLLCQAQFLDLGMTVQLTTDDGSAGDQCLVTQPVEALLDDTQPSVIYACGPIPMLKCVLDLALERGIPCQISIETMMACGMGACLGCAVEPREERATYFHACLDGPVFEAQKISF